MDGLRPFYPCESLTDLDDCSAAWSRKWSHPDRYTETTIPQGLPK